MKHFFQHIRIYIFRGLLAVIPLLLCAFAVQLLYVVIDKRIIGFLNNFFEVRKIPGMGIFLVFIALYVTGLIVSNFIGHRLLRLIELITKRIPFIGTIYGVGKQLSHGLSLADGQKQAFKKAVLVKINNDGLLVPAFVMSSMKSRTSDEEYLFVLIPTAPTPASGFVSVVKASQTVDPGWTVEECLKAIISIGIITPKEKGIDL